MRRPRQWEMGSLDKYVGMIFTGVVLLSMANIVVTLVILHYLMGIGGQYYLLYALAIVPVVNAVVGLSLRRFGRKRYQREQALVESINRVAQGDLNVWLNEQDAGSFEMVYQNFNKMVLGLRNQKLVNENFINDFSHVENYVDNVHNFLYFSFSEDIMLMIFPLFSCLFHSATPCYFSLSFFVWSPCLITFLAVSICFAK